MQLWLLAVGCWLLGFGVPDGFLILNPGTDGTLRVVTGA